MYDNLVLGKGITDNVYIGTLNKIKTRWIHKRDITNMFLQTVLERWNGYEEEIIGGDGKRYLISCREIVEDNDSDNKLKKEIK
jgi:hypothetical protein